MRRRRRRATVAAKTRPRGGESAETSRGEDAAATWTLRGDVSRRRRGRDVNRPWRQVERRRGSSSFLPEFRRPQVRPRARGLRRRARDAADAHGRPRAVLARRAPRALQLVLERRDAARHAAARRDRASVRLRRSGLRRALRLLRPAVRAAAVRLRGAVLSAARIFRLRAKDLDDLVLLNFVFARVSAAVEIRPRTTQVRRRPGPTGADALRLRAAAAAAAPAGRLVRARGRGHRSTLLVPRGERPVLLVAALRAGRLPRAARGEGARAARGEAARRRRLSRWATCSLFPRRVVCNRESVEVFYGTIHVRGGGDSFYGISTSLQWRHGIFTSRRRYDSPPDKGRRWRQNRIDKVAGDNDDGKSQVAASTRRREKGGERAVVEAARRLGIQQRKEEESEAAAEAAREARPSGVQRRG